VRRGPTAGPICAPAASRLAAAQRQSGAAPPRPRGRGSSTVQRLPSPQRITSSAWVTNDGGLARSNTAPVLGPITGS